MPPHRAFEIRRDRQLAQFRTPVWKLQKRERPRDQRPGMDPEHLANIRKLPCTLCGEIKFTQAHHLQSGPARKERGLGLKATDRWALSICPWHHEDLHRYGSRKECDYFAAFGIDCYELANGLWSRRGSVEDMARVLLAHQIAASAQKARTSQPY